MYVLQDEGGRFFGRKKPLLHLKVLVMTLQMLIYLKLKKAQNKV